MPQLDSTNFIAIQPLQHLGLGQANNASICNFNKRLFFTQLQPRIYGANPFFSTLGLTPNFHGVNPEFSTGITPKFPRS